MPGHIVRALAQLYYRMLLFRDKRKGVEQSFVAAATLTIAQQCMIAKELRGALSQE